MVEFAIPEALAKDPAELELALEGIANVPGVFLLWPHTGRPYLARTNVLRRRLRRMLANLGANASRVEYEFTGSRLEAQFLLLDLARRYLGSKYREEIRLRFPPYVKLIQTNPFPRTTVTARIGRAKAIYFGPFRNRSTAARFESEFL